jgi:hypothetical protein
MRDASAKKIRERLFVPSDELRFGWQKTIANLKSWLWLGAIGAFLSILQNALSRPSGAVAMRPLLVLCIQALQVGVTLAAFRIALGLADDRPFGDFDPKVLLAGYFPFLLTQILFGLIVAGGMLLLIVPGFIWAVTYVFAPLLCAAEGFDPVESLRESRRLTMGHRRSLFVFGLLCLGVNILGAFALGIGLFVTIPTTVIAMAHVLRRLQEHSPRSLIKRDPTPTPLVPGPHVQAH